LRVHIGTALLRRTLVASRHEKNAIGESLRFKQYGKLSYTIFFRWT
jgi:hypothetical protein